MWPIGPLMHEHRLIERMVELVDRQAGLSRDGSALDPGFVLGVVDFFRRYADRCHHGKEEDILFRNLEEMELEPDLAGMMAELVDDHRYGRRLVGDIEKAGLAHSRGDNGAGAELVRLLKGLTVFYPAHIKKEDEHFFYPVMELFDEEAKNRMLDDFYFFDRQLVHEFYRQRVEQWEGLLDRT